MKIFFTIINIYIYIYIYIGVVTNFLSYLFVNSFLSASESTARSLTMHR